MKNIFVLIFLSLSLSTFATSTLEGEINLAPPAGSNPKIIDPGTPISVSIVIENSGNAPNPKGVVFIRFAFANPLHEHTDSELFRTEEQEVISIAPGKKATINFKKMHKWPSIFDFIRQNWCMRQYQAVVRIGEEEKVIGTAAVAFSMHYYPGPKHEQPKVFPGVEN